MEQLLLERKRKLSMANVKRKYESQAKKDRRLGLILMIPIILVVFGIMGYPFCRALYLSFTNKVVGKPEEFVGLENYIKLFHDPIYWKSLKNTLVYTVGCKAPRILNIKKGIPLHIFTIIVVSSVRFGSLSHGIPIFVTPKEIRRLLIIP